MQMERVCLQRVWKARQAWSSRGARNVPESSCSSISIALKRCLAQQMRFCGSANSFMHFSTFPTSRFASPADLMSLVIIRLRKESR